MKRFLFLLAAAFSLSVFAQKTPAVKENDLVTLTTDSIKFKYRTVEGDPINARIYTLKNGLTVMLSVNKREPRVKAMVAVKTGSKNDPADNTGLAHYLEHMLFKGTENYGTKNYQAEKKYLNQIETLFEIYGKTSDTSLRKEIYYRIDSLSNLASKKAIANEYDKMMQIIGAQGTNAFTSFDQTVYLTDVPANQLMKFLEIEAERFKSPVFRLFHTELEAVYEEKNMSLDNDYSKLYERLFAGVFPGHPYGRQTTIGTVEHLKNPSITAIREYYNKYYVPSNMALILSGDFDPDAVIESIDKHFSYMYDRPLPPSSKPRFPNVLSRKSADTVYGPKAEMVAIGFRLPAGNTKGAVYYEMISRILYNGKAGLMDENLINNQKVQTAYSFAYPLNDAGMQVFMGQPKEGQSLDEVKDLMLEQLEKIKKGDFDEKLLNSALDNMEVEELYEYKTNDGRAYEMMEAFVLGLQWDQYLRLKDAYKKIRKEDLVAFANENYKDFTVVYKKTGPDTSIAKIEKPHITPIELNKDEESEFLKTHAYTDVPEIKPQFLDYEKDMNKITLANGLPFYSIRNWENNLFTLYYIVEMGELHDLKMAYSFSLLRYLGTEKYTMNEIHRKFYDLACDFGVYAGEDITYVYLYGLQKNFDEAFTLFEHLMREAKPDQKALDDLVGRTLKSREDAKKEKSWILHLAMKNYALYGKDNPFTYHLSERELKDLKAEEQVEKIKSLFSYPHNIFYFGPNKADSVGKFLEVNHSTPTSFKEIPKKKEFTYVEAPKQNIVYFTEYDMVQAEVLWTRSAGQYDPNIRTTASVFNEYFDGSMGTVVFQELRESKALAYSTYARFSMPSRPEKHQTVMAYIGTQSDKLMDAIPAMNKLFDTPPTEDKPLRVAKASLRQNIETERKLEHEIFMDYLRAKDMGRDFDIRKKTYNEINEVSLKNISDFQQKYFAQKSFYYCVIGSKERVSLKDLEKIGKVKVLSLEEIFGY